MISSYPKIYNLGHRAVRDIFKHGPVVCQEKVDGSQISFMKDDNGEVWVRSKNQVLDMDDPPKMFRLGVNAILSVKDLLVPNNVYRGEYLQKLKHNVLTYKRVPENHIALFDIQIGLEDYLDPRAVTDEASYLGMDSVPYWLWNDPSLGEIEKELERESFLGGPKVEGIVFKNYLLFDQHTGKATMGKFVSEAFKETHRTKTYKKSNKDVIQGLIDHYTTEARWQKAVQYLKEIGECEDSPTDIGKLIKRVQLDLLEECADEIKDALFKWGWKQVAKGASRGLPEWYKQQLLEKQFEESE